ncbi:MAG: glutathione synthase [Chloroflexi bacterium]|nr:glutathione synthase [Chloroflexota bacterium]
MILICGIPSETPITLVTKALTNLGVNYVMFNQRNFKNMSMRFELNHGQITGLLSINGHHYPLERFQGVYTRLMDVQQLPELATEPPNTLVRQNAQILHETLMHWYEIAPIRVVNRTEPMGSNFSKPYQSQLISKHGFLPPETIITNNPEAVQCFWNKHKQIIYKSISGIRSIVQTFTEDDLSRLDLIRWCPTQFQLFVPGTNIRVHVVNTAVFATSIDSKATDYRYAVNQVGNSAQLTEVKLPDELAKRCVDLTQSLGLIFAGIDLKITPNGDVYCFEVNPSPAYSYYESHTGQPIAEAVASYLANKST